MHTIRLGPPWEVSAVGSTTRLMRHFGRPRTLDADERLWLVCAHVPGPAEVTVNGEAAGGAVVAGPFAADITDRLRPRNIVAFAVASAEPLGPVALEVRAATDTESR